MERMTLETHRRVVNFFWLEMQLKISNFYLTGKGISFSKTSFYLLLKKHKETGTTAN